MSFISGASYTRAQIHDEVGGDKVSYLPQKEGRIVCGCFSTERNPEAPTVILVGHGAEEGSNIVKRAELLLEHRNAIPVFLKQAANAWQFDGVYRAQGATRDPAVIAQKQREAGRDDVAMVLYLEPADPPRQAYLLTWNPERWRWDNIEEQARVTAAGRTVIDHWSCGRRRNIEVGDRLFLLRQGVEPRGIIAAGYAISKPEEAPHWDPERQEQGETALGLGVRFERILNPNLDEPLPLAKLQIGRLASVNWRTQISGIDIGDPVDELEKLWAQHVGLYDVAGEELAALEGELRIRMIRHRARERWLRDAKLSAHKEAHGGRLPCEVPGCGFDFRAAYGDVGRDYAQVHHLRPLADRTRPSLTKLSELAVVCANCHVMIHAGGQCRPLEGLITR
jgi:5-methylcytosine-specific restriction protein A